MGFMQYLDVETQNRVFSLPLLHPGEPKPAQVRSRNLKSEKNVTDTGVTHGFLEYLSGDELAMLLVRSCYIRAHTCRHAQIPLRRYVHHAV